MLRRFGATVFVPHNLTMAHPKSMLMRSYRPVAYRTAVLFFAIAPPSQDAARGTSNIRILFGREMSWYQWPHPRWSWRISIRCINTAFSGFWAPRIEAAGAFGWYTFRERGSSSCSSLQWISHPNLMCWRTEILRNVTYSTDMYRSKILTSLYSHCITSFTFLTWCACQRVFSCNVDCSIFAPTLAGRKDWRSFKPGTLNVHRC